ncbi:MAG: ATP synthase subunit I [Acidimicrobiales bacterium]|jgi:hypothetical protein
MEQLAAVLGQLDLPDISRMLRRTVYATAGLGVVVFVVLCVIGYPLAGLGACIGLGLGLANIRLVMSTATRLNASSATKIKRPMALNTLMRLALTTVVIVVLAILNLSLGFGVLGGITVFYLLFVVSMVVIVLHDGAAK